MMGVFCCCGSEWKIGSSTVLGCKIRHIEENKIKNVYQIWRID